ncbi:MAG: glycerophosphodiester phosphodiesterase [Thermoleophilia bacterium]|nr:glycerophosphodiester phosphodiesterase [Thermoleophilia bacterium]
MIITGVTRSVVGTSPAAKQVAAHRGFHDGNAPYENTVSAYRAAVRIGADLMETDIRRTADGVLVLHHDASISGAYIAETRYADLPLLPGGERMSKLQDLVDAAASDGGHTRLLVETKEHGYEAQVVSMLRARLAPSQFDLMSFDLDSVKALRQLAPDSKVGVLFGLIPDWQNGEWPISGAQIVAKARRLGVDFVAIDAHIANNERLQTIADAGFGIAVWTVDKQLDIQKYLADARVHTIITNAPDLAMRLRDKAPTGALASGPAPVTQLRLAPPIDAAVYVTGSQAADWWHDAVAV